MAPPFCPFGAAAAASPRADPVRGRVAPAPAVADAGRDVLVRPLAPADAGLAVLELRVPLAPVFAEPAAGFTEPAAGFTVLELRVPLFTVFAELAAGFAAPDVRRAVLWVARAAPVAAAVALAACASSAVQFRNMKNCWPSVHRLVVTQYRTSPYCQY
ncbi:MAG TPA: hypothetical protein VJ305_13055, partial [Streptosporangiaceae bacterium]|nr:hypothetical protein [Streptosporangiaceae bacterium]